MVKEAVENASKTIILDYNQFYLFKLQSFNTRQTNARRRTIRAVF